MIFELASKSNNRGSMSIARRLERDKVMQVRGLRGSENLVCKREYLIAGNVRSKK